MLSFFSLERKMRQNAKNWLDVASKVFHYRRDELSASEVEQITRSASALRQQYETKADANKLKSGIETLEGVLRKSGGKIYPQSGLAENVEFFLVAAIFVIGFQFYFFRPFKIPTNSMWPTYYGMTPRVYSADQPEPGTLARIARFVAFGASRYELVAPTSGEVSLPITDSGGVAYEVRRGRKWIILPATYHVYSFRVNDEPVEVSVPEDFRMEEIIVKMMTNRSSKGFKNESGGPSNRVFFRVHDDVGYYIRWRSMGFSVNKGEKIVSFDILTGDQLFVDRISYHFVKPSVGSGFVFRTGDIHSPAMMREGAQIDSYYIKRLVGVPGDTLEVKSPVLYRNGAPITGADAFKKNAKMEGLYPGYTNVGSLDAGKKITVPEQSYWAMGDNSPNSADSRYWGFVPAAAVVGRPLFIYYPFTERWGRAK